MALFFLGGIWIHFINGYVYTPQANPMDNPLTSNVLISQGAWLENYLHTPLLLATPLLGFLGALGVIRFAKKERMTTAFVASSLSLTGVIATMGIALFPFIIPSENFPAQSLLVWNASSSARSLTGIIVCGVIMVPIILLYTLFVYKKLWGRGERMSVERIEAETKSLY